MSMESLEGLIGPVVAGGVVLGVTQSVFGSSKDSEFDEEKQKKKEKELKKKRSRRRTRASSNDGEGGILQELENTSFEDFG